MTTFIDLSACVRHDIYTYMYTPNIDILNIMFYFIHKNHFTEPDHRIACNFLYSLFTKKTNKQRERHEANH